MKSFIEQIRYSENMNLKKLCRIVRSECQIGVYGAGGYAKTLISNLKLLSVSVCYCVVDDIFFNPEATCCGVKVLSLENVNKDYRNTILIIGFGLNYENEKKEIDSIRDKIDNSIEIIDFEDQFLSYFYYMDYSDILKNSASYQYLYERLEDDESKELFVEYVNGRISGDLHTMNKFAVSNLDDYRLDLLLGRAPQNGGIILDCGAFDGKSAIQMNKYLKGTAKIFALECDPWNYELLCDNVKYYKQILPIRKGAWDHCGTNQMSGIGQDACIAGRESEEGESASVVKMVALDEFIKEPVFAIAMDVEGSEFRALSGAKRLIRKYRPSLAVRMYHKPDDFVFIPRLIVNMMDGIHPYKLYLRYDCHYRGAADLTLYAI